MHQYLFYIGDFPIRSYGLVLSLSIILAVGVGYFLAKQDGRWHEHIVDLGIYSGVAGILGARLWDVFFFDWDYYGNHITEIFNVWQGGMAIQGGVFLGTIAGIIYARKHNIDVLALADILAPAIILGQAIGRCANLLNGDAFGTPTGTGYGIIYPATTLAHHVYGSQPLWPAEVWEGQLDMVIFALLLLFRSFKHGRGQAFTLYVMLYSAARFFLEFLRGDYSELVFGICTSAQMTSIIAFVLALAGFIYCGWRDRNRKDTAEPIKTGRTSKTKRR
ncbi:prolipoprotein diacylglyceryl transferase [Pectinatus haikarae]|uniref:Phosphatidylglycerol--prolipoprotein diacylglyceryl transferase n=1 Tax=Pectinatus haikarae TaxID=349096 RepID=A0ABT9YAH8_9FIRM|nr:prolipoprotein diacylglyceryl transferase [Pectinatus haikarae]MDQ0204845.1 phosphatidylglycerol:prolipoprotein diacylglycerol transferase [Pectinatus haikarae]